jgi:hypothetical protein
VSVVVLSVDVVSVDVVPVSVEPVVDSVEPVELDSVVSGVVVVIVVTVVVVPVVIVDVIVVVACARSGAAPASRTAAVIPSVISAPNATAQTTTRFHWLRIGIPPFPGSAYPTRRPR